MSQSETGEVDVCIALESRLSELGFEVSDPEAVLEALAQVTLVPNHPTDQQVVEYAQEVLEREGEIELDDNAAVSRAANNESRGAYVAAWLWVRDEDCQAFLATRKSAKTIAVEPADESDLDGALYFTASHSKA